MSAARKPHLPPPDRALREGIRAADERLGIAPLLKKAFAYIFPDHWSFLIGEIALYSFLILVATGTYLAFFFEPSLERTTYEGSYLPLQGAEVSEAYASTLDIVFEVPAGLVVRQAHHWAALIFVVAIVLHLMRVFFTGAFRKPRDSNWIIGLTLLTLALLEGFAGYSMPDDLLSGMGLAIGYGTALSIPGIGAQVAFLIWGGEFPGDSNFIARLYIAHVFIFPIIIGLLIGAHLAIIMRQKHSQFPGRGRTQRNVIGYALMPGYSLRAIGMLLATAAVIFLLGGLIQINPIWQYGPYEPWLGTNGAQPDWYMGWLIGALRLMPPIELHIGDVTFIPNPAWGGLLFPGVVFTLLYLWPWLERKITGDYRRHDLLDRPRDRPHRTALGIAFFSWIVIIFVAGAADRILVDFGIPYEAQVWWFRLLAVIGPIVVYGAALLVLKELKRSEVRPMRRWSGTVLRRSRSGEYEVVAVEDGHGDGDSPAGEGGGNGANGGGNGSGAGGGGDRPASEATDSERT